MKIYGNSSSDGFPLLVTLAGGLFTAGGVGLATVGAASLLVAVPVFAGVVGLMVVRSRKWDVMSEAPVASADVANQAGAPIRLPNFPVMAQSDTQAEPTAAAWSPSKVTDSGLPRAVEKPKSAVETNTAVA